MYDFAWDESPAVRASPRNDAFNHRSLFLRRMRANSDDGSFSSRKRPRDDDAMADSPPTRTRLDFDVGFDNDATDARPPLPHKMESSLPWGQGLDASRGALCGGCGGRASVASSSKPKRVRVGGESVMASSSRGRLRDEKEPSSEFARMRRRNRERWLNASLRGDARTAGDSSQAKSYM